MDKINIDELNNLQKKVKNIKYAPNRFKLQLDNGYFIMGAVTAPNGGMGLLGKIQAYNTLYDTLVELDWKIKLSLKKGIEQSFLIPLNIKSSFKISYSEKEQLAYYYVENAVFRISTLWDMLAQLYCLHYNVKISKNKINYKKIFNIRKKPCDCTLFKDKASEIYKYINEKIKLDSNDECKGNHKFVSNYRNKLIHRNSPNLISISNFDINIRQHPAILLNIIIRDYIIVSNYIDEILTKVEKEEIDPFKKEFNF